MPETPPVSGVSKMVTDVIEHLNTPQELIQYEQQQGMESLFTAQQIGTMASMGFFGPLVKRSRRTYILLPYYLYKRNELKGIIDTMKTADHESIMHWFHTTTR